MIKRITFLAAFLLFVSLFVSAIETPALHVEGKYIKDPSGNTVILRGLSFASVWEMAEREGPRYSFYPHTEEPDVNKARIKALIDLATDASKGWYARVLRFPVYPVAESADPGWLGTNRARYKELIQCAVDYATSKNVYSIIDWHYIDHYGDKVDETNTFWNWAAPLFKNNENVIFEIYNEPISYADHWDDSQEDRTWASFKSTLAQPVVDRIRNVHNADNLILVGGPQWSQLIAGADANPISGGNIVYVAHIYPFQWEGLGGQTISQMIGTTINNKPVFFTEWGFENAAPIPCDATDENAYAQGMMDYLNQKGASWTGWCFDPYWKPVMFDNWDFVNILGNSLPNTGGYQGKFIQDFLNTKKNSNLPSSGGAANPVTRIERRNAPSTAIWIRQDGGLINLDANTWTGTKTQWERIDAGSGYYYFKNLSSNQYLHRNGSDVDQVAATNDDCKWQLVDSGTAGYYRIQSKTDGKWIKADHGTGDVFMAATSNTGDWTKWAFPDV